MEYLDWPTARRFFNLAAVMAAALLAGVVACTQETASDPTPGQFVGRQPGLSSRNIGTFSRLAAAGVPRGSREHLERKFSLAKHREEVFNPPT